MSSTVRLTSLLGFLVLNLAACGGSSPGENCDACGTQESALPCGSTSRCDEPSEPPPPPPTTKTLRLRLRNASGTPRECSPVTVAKVKSDGSYTLVTVASGGIVDDGGESQGTISVPTGMQLSGNASCWKIGTTNTERVTGSFPILLDTNKDCVMIYEFDGIYASMRMECATF